jgi:putative membrane protein insertion efficiency factor
MKKPSFPARLLLALIRAYQLTFSLFLGKSCRYHPTCSHYAAESVRRFGALGGFYLGCGRILRCHPWAPGGHDPVPESFSLKKTRPMC